MAALQQALRAYRSQKATQLSQPAFCVFSNAELDGLVAACPHSVSELLGVKGFGKAKVSKFGDDLVRICSGHSKPPPGSLPAAAPPAAAPKRKLPSGFPPLPRARQPSVTSG